MVRTEAPIKVPDEGLEGNGQGQPPEERSNEPEAHYQLAVSHAQRTGELDHVRAVELYEAAASGGNQDAIMFDRFLCNRKGPLWPVIESTTNNVSIGFRARCSTPISAIMSAST